MPVTHQRVLDYLNIEWPAYVPAIQATAPEKRDEFLKAQGYARLADLVAHIAGWWDEAYGVLLATVEGREIERKKYDFDQFNAASVARFKDSSEADVLAFFEKQRQNILALLRAHSNLVNESRRVQNWCYAVIIHHAAEHSFAASRFLSLDWLTNDWATYPEKFKQMPAEAQQKFLAKQGFVHFRDVVAHIVAWFGEAHTGIAGFVNDPAYKHPSRDIDSFNAEAVKTYGDWKEEDVYAAFELARQKLTGLVSGLPEETIRQPRVQDWLMGDVIEHYFEHEF